MSSEAAAAEASSRSTRQVQEGLTKRNFAVCYIIATFFIVGSIIVGAFNPLPVYYEKMPSAGTGTEVDLQNVRCSSDIYGRSDSVAQCWHHYFRFPSVWTQYFALVGKFKQNTALDASYVSKPTKFKVAWWGRKKTTDASKLCNRDDQCTSCISSDRSLNVADSCMPEACGNCCLDCYLCLRSVSDSATRVCTSNNKLTAATACTAEGSSYGAWEKIAHNRTVTRTIVCPRGHECDETVFFKTSHVEYDEYYFQVQLVSEPDRNYDWMHRLSFTIRYQNHAYAQYEIGFKYTFLAVNIIAILIMERMLWNLKKSGVVVQTVASRSGNLRKAVMPSAVTWLRLLQYGLVLHNNPFYALTYVNDARRFFSILGVIWQIVFLAILLTFWLAEFEQLAKDRPDMIPCCERTFSSVFRNTMLILFVCAMIPTYCFVKMQELSDPLYDFTEDSQAWAFAKIFGGLWIIIYGVGLIYYTVKNFGAHFCTSNSQCSECLSLSSNQPSTWRKSWMFVMHWVVILVCLGGLGFGALQSLHMDSVYEFLFFNAIFNVYVHTVVVLYTPSGLASGEESQSMIGMEKLEEDDDIDDMQDVDIDLGNHRSESTAAASI